ncbi:hypothetical protein T484DRAFT_1898299 [Baffinella frigidus]|nr:hypothetical protein T484DRAFT_1898299 [Cryptophyta sp. CCMP2293]
MSTKILKALNIPSLQPTQPVAEKLYTLPRVLAIKRPTITAFMRLPGDFPAVSAKIEEERVMPGSLAWLDKLEISLEKPVGTPSKMASRLDRVLGLWGPSDAAPLPNTVDRVLGSADRVLGSADRVLGSAEAPCLARCWSPHGGIRDEVGGWILL